MSRGPNSFGSFFRITTFGESHGYGIGVVLDGVRPGIEFDIRGIQKELDRRRPGQNEFVTPRKEPDRVEIVSGVFNGRTTGAPLCLLIRNVNADPEAYNHLKNIFRPGHADFTFLAKYGIRDWRGGGRSSGRETAARVAAGAAARQLLKEKKVSVIGFTRQIGPIQVPHSAIRHLDRTCENGDFAKAARMIESSPVRCPDNEASESMKNLVAEMRKAGDSIGGVVELRAYGVPPGWGDPVFWKLDAELAAGVMSIGGVKGIEIGGGFALSENRGSESNDAIGTQGFETNLAGGMLGGISNGSPIIVRLAVKPTPSIGIPQKTMDAKSNPCIVETRGRHDPCLAPRVVTVAQGMMCLVLAEASLRQDALMNEPADTHALRLSGLRSWEDLFSALKRIQNLRQTGLNHEDIQKLAIEYGISQKDLQDLKKLL